MKKRTLIIAEILSENKTNGVSRYVEMLLDGMPLNLFELIYLKFVLFERISFHKIIKHDNYIEIVIPLPINSNEILKCEYWYSEYNKLVEHILEPYLRRGFIFHIQTINLIGLAIFLRQKYKCKIVSHIHCIPWKYKYSSDQQEFNKIYYKFNINGDVKDYRFRSYITNDESLITRESDAIICVTKSAKKYYERYLHVKPEKVVCVYNGIRDELFDSNVNVMIENRKEDGPYRILYTGDVDDCKGFQFILDALRIVDAAGYKYILLVAGALEKGKKMHNLIEDYKDLNINFLGHIDYSELQKIYQSSHIGLIPSLFEQCSYVALEMSMYGLPVVYSDIEELNEIFNRVDNMYVSVGFSIHSSLNLDVSEFAVKIINLMQSTSLRRKIGINEREKYLRFFTQESMIHKTIDVYNNLYK